VRVCVWASLYACITCACSFALHLQSALIVALQRKVDAAHARAHDDNDVEHVTVTECVDDEHHW
jgi:hypothetical protein